MNLLSFLKPQILAIYHSKFNGEIKIIESFGRKIIVVDGAEQSGGTIVPMWRQSVEKMHDRIGQIESCLLLGLAGGTIISELTKHYPSIHITSVEIDPVMIEIAKKYFPQNVSGNVEFINTDAFEFLKKTGKQKYDLIIADLYLGKLNPKASQVKGFLIRLKEYLKEKGHVLFNRHYQKDGEDYRNFLIICRQVFPKVVELLTPPFSRILLLG